MLALAPPLQQHTAIPYSQSSASSALRPSARVVSGSRRTPSYSVAAHSSSSTSFNVTAHNDNRSSTQEDSTSYRSGPLPSQLPQISQAASSSSHQNEDDHQGGSLSHPIPAAENIVPSSRFESEAREIDIHSYDPQDLLRLLASLLNQIATTNDNITGRDMHASTAYQSHPSSPNSPTYESHHPPIWRTLTTASRSALASNMSLTFHARNVPTISLEAYLLRILKYCPASNEVFLSLLVYFDRMSKLAKDACGRAFIIDSYNIHRLVIAGVTVASKFFSDVFYTNSRYAKVGGLPQAELNQLELQFLLLNDFRLMISTDEMQRYAEQLIHFSHSNREPSTPSIPSSPSPGPSQHQSPTGPAKAMGGKDGYQAQRSVEMERHTSNVHPSQTPLVGGRVAYRRSSDSYSSAYSTTSTDAASESAETDFDGSTDDEPTIRPAHSSASSETMSLRSVASDADSIITDDGDRSGDDPESGAHTPGETHLRDYRMMSP